MILTPIRILIVEDQAEVRNYIRHLVEQQEGYIVVGSCGSVREANMLIRNTAPDVLILDIVLPDGTAFDILNESLDTHKVIFLTHYEQYAVRAFKFDALDYIVKPIDTIELHAALKKATVALPVTTDQIRTAEKLYTLSNRLVLTSQQFMQVVPFEDIVYCEGHEGYTTFVLSSGKKLVSSKYLKMHEKSLADFQFIRTHQSFIVNILYIDIFDKQTGFIHLKGGT